MIKVAEGVYECDIDKECMYKDEYGKCYYYGVADTYLYHMGEIPVPTCCLSD